MKNQTFLSESLTEGQLKAIALLQFNNEDYFVIDDEEGTAYIFKGQEDAAKESFAFDIKDTEEADITANFLIFCQNNEDEVPEINGDDETDGYMVLTDDEADKKWEESLDSYLEECIYPELPDTLSNYFDDEKWKTDARMDGRGHSLSGYDGHENEEVIPSGDTFYIYRIS